VGSEMCIRDRWCGGLGLGMAGGGDCHCAYNIDIWPCRPSPI